ncbi:MAG: IclR family transcriptional regulator [Frankiales bacterium]|nr:IclR family transcriptional regulator [Frankiales bacterium]
MKQTSGVGVLDKAVVVLDAVQAGAHSLAQLTEATGLSRATAHRLAVALEVHRFLAREGDGRWQLGSRLSPVRADDLLERAGPVLARLRDVTGESAQLYRRQGDSRVCVAAAELTSGLRDTVPVGAALPMSAGSAAQVLLAFGSGDVPEDAAFTPRVLADVRRRGWAHSVGEREQGVASVSAPVLVDGALVAAVSVSGPIERLTRQPGRLHAPAVLAAAHELSS